MTMPRSFSGSGAGGVAGAATLDYTRDGVRSRFARTIPHRLNMALGAAHVVINLFVLCVLPLALVPRSRWWLLAVALVALTTNALWALLHEAIHSNFHPSAAVNRLAGRVLSVVCYGAPFRAVAAGHLVHHRLNVPTGYYDRARTTRLRANAHYYWTLFSDPYVLAFASNVLLFLPRRVLRSLFRHNRVAQSLLSDAALGEVRLDAALFILMLAASVVCYGRDWWAVAVIYITRCLLISFLDAIYHFHAKFGDNMQGYHLRLPSPLQLLLLNFNLHGVHHRNPRLPWRTLPAAFVESGGRYDDAYLPATLRQLLPVRAMDDDAREFLERRRQSTSH